MTARRLARAIAWRVLLLLAAGLLVAFGLSQLRNFLDPSADNSPVVYGGTGALVLALGMLTALPVITFGASRQMLATVAVVVALSLQLVPFEVLYGWTGVRVPDSAGARCRLSPAHEARHASTRGPAQALDRSRSP